MPKTAGSKVEKVRELIREMGIDTPMREIRGALARKGINVHDSSIYAAKVDLRKHKKAAIQSVEPRAKFDGEVTRMNKLKAFFVEHGVLSYGQAQPLLKAENLDISESWYHKVSRKWRKSNKTQQFENQNGTSQQLSGGAVVAVIESAKSLVDKLGKDDAIKIIRTLF